MKKTIKIIVAIVIAVVAVGIFVWGLNIEKQEADTTAPTDAVMISEFMASNKSTVDR